MRSNALALLLVLLSSSASSVAVAQPGDPTIAAARDHFNAGIKLYDKADYEGALAEFRAAHDAHPSSQIAVNVALCLRQLGRNAEAIETLEPLLQDPKVDASTRTATEKTLAELRAKVATIRIHVVMNVAPGTHAPDPSVMLDDNLVPRGKVLQPIWVDPGPHRVAAHAAGFPEASVTIAPKAGERDVSADLSLVATSTSTSTTTSTEPGLDVKIADPSTAHPKIAIPAEKKWYLGASVGFFGGELPVRAELGGGQALVGGIFALRLGRRFGDHFSIEIDGEVMGGGTREAPVDDTTTTTTTKRSFAVSHIALGAGPRYVTGGSGPARFTFAAIGGVVNQKIVQNDHPEGVGHPKDGAPTGFLQVEAGGQLDTGSVITLEAVAFIGMIGLNSDNYLSALHTVMTRGGAKVALQFSF